jgi:hypothetical protein
MPHPDRADLDALVQSLLEARVELIVVGGAAAVLHGAPIATQDLDIVHRRTPENTQRFFRSPRKSAAGRARDKLVLPILLALRGRKESEP